VRQILSRAYSRAMQQPAAIMAVIPRGDWWTCAFDGRSCIQTLRSTMAKVRRECTTRLSSSSSVTGRRFRLSNQQPKRSTSADQTLQCLTRREQTLSPNIPCAHVPTKRQTRGQPTALPGKHTITPEISCCSHAANQSSAATPAGCSGRIFCNRSAWARRAVRSGAYAMARRRECAL